MRNGRGRIISWDLDETLGDFRDYGNMRLTRGIKPLLEDLRGQGFRHVVATAAMREHAEYVLSAFGLRGLFDAVFSREDICDAEYNKHYSPIIRALAIPAEEAPGRILAVGNFRRDAPADMDIVFLYHPLASCYSASVHRSIISSLAALSDSWSGAHSTLVCGSCSSETAAFEGTMLRMGGTLVGVGRCRREDGLAKKSDRMVRVLEIPEPCEMKKEKRSLGLDGAGDCGDCEPVRRVGLVLGEPVQDGQRAPEV